MLFTAIRRFVIRSVVALLLVAYLFGVGDVVRLNPAQEVAFPHLYSLAEFEVGNFFSKWFHWLYRTLPWNRLSDEERIQKVQEYFQRGEDNRTLRDQIAQALSAEGPDVLLRVEELEGVSERIKSRRGRLRNDVEQTLESAISSVIREEGLDYWAGLIWPPVDLRFSEPPKVLVTSPRDRIFRMHSELLRPNLSFELREEIEDDVLNSLDLSALVTNIGGLATYPAAINNDRSLRWTLEIGAHEWLHHYLAFKPLGWNILDNKDMEVLNETMANIAGDEMGQRALQVLGLTSPTEPNGSALTDQGGFDFDREMRVTRLRVDELLAAGKIAEAEDYMEERRKLFVENGYHIRKLNQAYFAFNGTYADNPASVSPIADQLRQLRSLVPDLGTFIKTVSKVSTYPEFLETLKELQDGRSARETAPYVDPVDAQGAGGGLPLTGTAYAQYARTLQVRPRFAREVMAAEGSQLRR